MTPRIEALTNNDAPADSRMILERTKAAIGMVPNLHRTLAHSPAALEGYVALANALNTGALDRKLRESIAVATASFNRCAYCASAHTAIGKSLGIDATELSKNLTADSNDSRARVVLSFVETILETRGDVDDSELAKVREAGFSDREIVEIISHVGMNTLTNMFNGLARTTIDFPVVDLPTSRTH